MLHTLQRPSNTHIPVISNGYSNYLNFSLPTEKLTTLISHSLHLTFSAEPRHMQPANFTDCVAQRTPKVLRADKAFVRYLKIISGYQFQNPEITLQHDGCNYIRVVFPFMLHPTFQQTLNLFKAHRHQHPQCHFGSHYSMPIALHKRLGSRCKTPRQVGKASSNSCFPGISRCQGTIRSSKPTPCAANSMRSQSPVTSAHESFPFNKMVSKTHSLSSLSAKNGFKMEGFPKYPGVAMWLPFPPFPAVSRALPRGDKEAYLWIAGDGWRWLEHLIENDIDIQRTKDGFLRCFKFNTFGTVQKLPCRQICKECLHFLFAPVGHFILNADVQQSTEKKPSSQVCA